MWLPLIITIEKSNSILPVFEFFVIVNWSRFARPESPVTSKYLYNKTVSSRFGFCLNRKVDVASEASRTVNDVSSTLLLGVSYAHHNHLRRLDFFINEHRIFHLFLVIAFHFWLTLDKHKKAWEIVFQKYLMTICLLLKRGWKIKLIKNGGTDMKLYSIKIYLNTLAPLQTRMQWKNLF